VVLSGPPLTQLAAATHHCADGRAFSDEHLVRLAHAGQADAFGLLYQRHRDEVLRFLYRRTLDRDLAEDLRSEAFVRALHGLSSFSGGNFGAWVTSIARNLVVDHFRCSRVKLEVPVHEWWGLEEPFPGPDALLLEKLGRTEARGRVARLMSHLTADQHTCLVLRFFHHHTPAETAAVMSRSVGAIKLLQHRAIRAMRDALQDASHQVDSPSVARR
jgi:RNA polymerase sigma-70 factor, ECF subfamily